MNATNGSDAGARFNQDAVHEKYLAERDKRLVAGRAAIRDLAGANLFTKYREDPFTPFVHREPVTDEIDVAVVGAGIGGLVAGARPAQSRDADRSGHRQAGGVGGTWYWNRYPGVMCDVESYIYMPMLEDLDYVPRPAYAFGDEIRSTLEAIAKKYDLVDDALFHTSVQDDIVERRERPLGPPHRPW